MIAFYKRWLAQRQSDPAAALRETLRDPDPALRAGALRARRALAAATASDAVAKETPFAVDAFRASHGHPRLLPPLRSILRG